LTDRLRFAFEIVQEIKNRVGKHYPVTYRYGLRHYLKAFDRGAVPGEEFEELGRDLDESIEMAKLLEEAGYDALHIDAGGSYNSYYWAHPPMYMEHGVGLDAIINNITDAVNIPVMVCSRFDNPRLAEKVLKEEKADMVVIGRGLLADAFWPQKVREGRIEDIRPCIACDTGCQGRMNAGGTLSCAVNPICCKEKTWALQPIQKAKNIMVVGGGIGGMEAARVAAVRGHNVTLYEKTKELGGHLIVAGIPEFKRDLKRLLIWYKNQMKKLGIEIFTDTEVTSKLVDEKEPDEIIMATGSKPTIPNIPGIDNPKVCTAIEVLQGHTLAGDKVAVIGAGLIGCEVALWLANKGKKVVLIEKLSKLMPFEIDHNANKEMLVGMLIFNGVEIRTNTALAAVIEEGINVVGENMDIQPIECDSVVLAVGLKAVEKLSEALQEKNRRFLKIGDCLAPRIILNAIWDGYKVANSI
jgi:2-enoate reductase